MKRLVHHRNNRQSGFSLVELMIALALGLIITAAASSAFIGANQTRTELDKTSRQYENGRYAIQLLVDELRLAGFWGEFYGSGFTVAEPVNPCLIATVANQGWDVAGTKYPPHIRGWENGDPGCSGMARLAGTDAILVRHAATDVMAPAQAGAYPADALLQNSRCSADGSNTPPIVSLGSAGAAAFTYKKKKTGDGMGVCSDTADIRRLQTYIYFVGNDMVLHRLEASGGNWSDVRLVDGIEDMHVEYDVDADNDGIVDQTDLLATAVGNWDSAVSATVYVLARNTESTSGYVDAKTYTLGKRIIPPKNDGFKRHVYSQKVFFANPAGRRATK